MEATTQAPQAPAIQALFNQDLRQPGHTGKPVLLAAGYWVEATGFTRVLEAVLSRLSNQYEIHLIGLSYKGPVKEGAFTVYPCNLAGGDVFGVFQARDFVARFQPALVFLLNDIWILGQYIKWLAPYQEQSKIVCYCPLDGKLRKTNLLAPFGALAHGSRLVVYTEFARDELCRAAALLHTADNSFRGPALAVIPHGVDNVAFHPLDATARRAARQALAPGLTDVANAFFVLNANRAQPRKRIDLTLQGFALFASDKPPDVFLTLHHAVTFADEKQQLLQQAASLGITDRVILSPSDEQRLSDQDLNAIYNACDVGVNTAMGEGWGLVSFEHAATGRAQVVPRHSACAELWRGAAEFMAPVATYAPSFAPLELAEVAPEGLAISLQLLYSQPTYLAALAQAAYLNATQPNYNWDVIADLWRAQLDQALSNHPRKN